MAPKMTEESPNIMEHETDGEDCWCNPIKEYIENGILIVHNKVPLIDDPDTEDVIL